MRKKWFECCERFDGDDGFFEAKKGEKGGSHSFDCGDENERDVNDWIESLKTTEWQMNKVGILKMRYGWMKMHLMQYICVVLCSVLNWMRFCYFISFISSNCNF